MKETKIEIPAGCEVEKTEIVDGEVVVTFKEKEPQLPRTWEEFCNSFGTSEGSYEIDTNSGIVSGERPLKTLYAEKDKKLLPNRETAEAVLALCQLIQLRDCYNQGWKPDWKDNKDKHVIDFYTNEIDSEYWAHRATSFLYFKTDELRDLFLENFHELIEKLKPLYGIMKGGEE